MRRAPRLACACLLALVVLPALILLPALPALADIVHLKNGRTIEGRVVSQSGGTVVVDMGNGVVRLPAGDVLYIERRKVTRDPEGDIRKLVDAGRAGEALARLRKGALDLPAERTGELRLGILRREAARLEKDLRLAEAHRLLVEAKTLAPGDKGIASAEDRLARRIEKLADLVRRARLSVQGGEPAEAAALFEKALELAPESRGLIGAEVARVYERLADGALRERDAGSAELYAKAIEADPSRAGDLRERYVHARLIPIFGQLKANDLGAARRGLEELVEYAPADSQARYVYGRLCETERKWKEARKHFLAALPKGERPWTPPPTTRTSVAALRKRVQAHLAGIRQKALSKRRERKERARVDPGPAKVLKGKHFTVTHRNSQIAKEVLEAADGQVGKLMRAAGEGSRSPWKERCPVYVHKDEQSFLVSTGMPQWSGGLANLRAVNRRLVSQEIIVYQTNHRLLTTTTPHEVTHLVFASLTDYQSGISLAVNEGLAVSQEPGFDERPDRGRLAWKRLTGELVPLAELFAMKDVGIDATLFYAQSASVVRFLLKKKDMRTFVRFAKDSATRGDAKALMAHYGYADVETLEREWAASLDR